MDLKEYRTEIRKAWLPLVGRQQLTSSEFEEVKKWHQKGVALAIVLAAIRAVRERNTLVYSIGVIKADMEKIKRERSRMEVGKPVAADTQKGLQEPVLRFQYGKQKIP